MGVNFPGGGFQAEINVTPLVDVVLVLLILFMVIVPLTLYGYAVDLPREATEPPNPAEAESVVLEIDAAGCAIAGPLRGPGLPADCMVRVNDEDVSLGDLPRRLSEALAGRAADQRVVFLAADRALNYEGVMRIVDLARSEVEGLRIGLVTEAASR